jgi:hypothetical protein
MRSKGADLIQTQNMSKKQTALSTHTARGPKYTVHDVYRLHYTLAIVCSEICKRDFASKTITITSSPCKHTQRHLENRQKSINACEFTWSAAIHSSQQCNDYLFASFPWHLAVLAYLANSFCEHICVCVRVWEFFWRICFRHT